MNCDKCQVLLSEFIDGSLNGRDYALLERHLDECLDCAEMRNDLSAIVGFCHEHRGEYDAPPNGRALWLRIRNVIESESEVPSRKAKGARAGGWLGFAHRSWELTLPQLAASVAVIVVVVSLVTVFGVRRLQGVGGNVATVPTPVSNLSLVQDRIRQQQQVIDYWNQRVELNRVRWTPQMRDTFDRNMVVIDTAVNDSLRELSKNPHDEVSEEVLNSALNDKVELLKGFADL
jgi:hypothetical protein